MNSLARKKSLQNNALKTTKPRMPSELRRTRTSYPSTTMMPVPRTLAHLTAATKIN